MPSSHPTQRHSVNVNFRSYLLLVLALALFICLRAAAQPDLSATFTNEQSSVYPGETIVYTLTLGNAGPSPATGATALVTFPPSIVKTRWECAGTGGATCGVGPSTGNLDQTLDFPVEGIVTYTIEALLDTAATGRLEIQATLNAPGGVIDPDLTNNIAIDDDEIVPQPVVNVRPVYANASPSANHFALAGITPASNGAAAFGGHAGDIGAPPDPGNNQPRYILKSSMFGVPLARYKASPTHLQDTIESARNELFYIPGRPAAENNAAAFRYISTFFGISTSGTVGSIQERLEDPLPYDATIDTNNSTESDEERALRVARDVTEALRFEPFNKDLRNLLLDIYYYRTLGRQIAAKDQVVKAYQLNFSTVISDNEPFGGPINKEITAFSTASNALSGVLDPYRELLFDNLGVDISEFDPGFKGKMPFGYYLFLAEVPYRSIYASTFANYDANSGEITGDLEPVDLGDAATNAALLVSPVGFNTDYLGRPSGSSESKVAITVANAGPVAMTWRATVQNPFEVRSSDTPMLSLRDANNTSVDTLAGTVAPTRDQQLMVHIAPNYQPTLRVGRIKVEDTAGGSKALSYTVVVMQQGNANPIISVSATEVVMPESDNDDKIDTEEITIQNEGTETLNWTASIEGDVEYSGVTWLLLKGPNESGFGATASGTDFSELEIKTKPYYAERGDGPAKVKIVADDPNTLPVYIDVYTTGTTPAPASTKAGQLLTLYPQEITTGKAAVQRAFRVEDGGAFAWSAAVNQGASWITIASQTASTGLVKLNIAANNGTAARTGRVRVTAPTAQPSTRDIVIYQDGTAATAITVTPASRTVTAASGASDPEPEGTGFVVTRAGTGNVSWTAKVTQGQDWLSVVSGESGQNDGEIQFTYDQNVFTAGRTGIVTIVSGDAIAGQNEIQVVVEQQGTAGAAVLSSGFKDLSLLYDVLGDEAQVKKELAKRYALRNLGGDFQQAMNLIQETITRHSAALNDVGNLIPDWRGRVDTSSDLVAKYFGWQQAVTELDATKDFLNGDANILGFQKDFLFLVQTFPGQPEDLFDSYNKLFEYMFDGENNVAVLTSPLGQAFDKFQTARDDYDNFVTTQDTLREELRTQNLDHRKWMYDVVGVDPGNDPDNPDDAEAYRNPGGNYGGDIWQQERSIERARQQLDINRAELERILGEINTELWRRSQEAQINARIGDIYIEFGDKVAVIEGIIGGINATQAVADNLTEAASIDKAILSGGAQTAARIANAVAQAAAEISKGVLEGEKAKLAAQENQAVLQLEDQILEVNSEALIANLYGEAAVVGVESGDLAIGLAQEIGRRQAQIDEWHYREDRMRENNAALSGRAFANPVHRLRMRRAMLEAESTFKVAQRWVFFTIRALEYKWNAPFVFSNASGDWSLDSLFRARTAKDLIDLMAAIRDFDGLLQGSARADDRFDWFSFKKDFMGLTPVYGNDGVTELPVYAHPLTGYAATATEVFRAKLSAAYDPASGIIALPFSTFNDNGETFFRGPRRDGNDPSVVLSRGQYLDKIVWMKVNLLGDFADADQDRAAGVLSYSGGSYVRNARVGRIPDLTRPDRIVDEFTRWPTKFWFFDAGIPNAERPVPAAWRSSDEQSTEIALSLTSEPRQEIPDSVSRIDVFGERSVACDGWELRIFTQEGNQTLLELDDIDDIEILFYHVSKDRPNFPPQTKGVEE